MSYQFSSMSFAEILRAKGDTLAPDMRECFENLLEGYTSSERTAELESRLDIIDDLIVTSNWRTGKKAELQELIQAIHENTDYSDVPD